MIRYSITDTFEMRSNGVSYKEYLSAGDERIDSAWYLYVCFVVQGEGFEDLKSGPV